MRIGAPKNAGIREVGLFLSVPSLGSACEYPYAPSAMSRSAITIVGLAMGLNLGFLDGVTSNPYFALRQAFSIAIFLMNSCVSQPVSRSLVSQKQ